MKRWKSEEVKEIHSGKRWKKNRISIELKWKVKEPKLDGGKKSI